MDEYKLISASDDYGFNIKLADCIKQGWVPFGELCANISVAKSDYSSTNEKLFSIMLIRKQDKKEN